jgi:hypothetical protein
MVVNFCVLVVETYSIYVIRNAWLGDLVCLCVMEDKSCAEQWLVEGVTALKKDRGMDGRR